MAEYFDSDWYRERYLQGADIDPWDHFVRYGDGERRSPGPRFDAEFYAGTYLALEERHALRHFLRQGRRDGLLPAPIPRSAEQSRAAMAGALAGLQHPVLLIGNDAQRAGAPLLLIELARHLRRRGWSPVFLLHRAGPLLDRLRAIGPTLVVAEGHDVAGLGAALEPETPILASTGWAAPILERLSHPGPAALLVHEMPDYLEREGLLEAVGRAPVLVAVTVQVSARLAERVPPGVPVRTVTPGLLHQVSGPAGVARIARLVDDRFGGGALIVIGAGFADERKGFDRFLAAAARIHDLEPRTGFVWLGDLGTWGVGLAEAAVRAGLPLMLPGFRLDADAWYDRADVYLLTSRQDPGPTTVMDAARRGVPFVAAPGDLGLPGLGEILDGVGWFVGEHEVAIRVLEVARAQTPELRRARGRHIEGHAHFGRYVDDLLGVLRDQGMVDEPGR